MLDLTGYNWVRFECTASASNVAAQNTDTSLQWNLYDAHAGNDGWKFGGTRSRPTRWGTSRPTTASTSSCTRRSSNDPAFEMAGHGGWSTATLLANIDGFLADFPGRYFGISLGTNDAPGNDPPAYLANMTLLVDKVLAAGKIPVVPTIPYTGEPPTRHPRVQRSDPALYATYGARLLQGPDLYTVIYDGRATMFDNPTDLHPNAAGNAAIRQAWACDVQEGLRAVSREAPRTPGSRRRLGRGTGLAKYFVTAALNWPPSVSMVVWCSAPVPKTAPTLPASTSSATWLNM